MRALPATVQVAVPAPTAYGGETSAWSDAAVVWVELTRAVAPASAASAADAPPERLDTAQGRCRTHPALAAGVRLATGDGPPWSVVELRPDDPTPGRCRLLLERLL